MSPKGPTGESAAPSAVQGVRSRPRGIRTLCGGESPCTRTGTEELMAWRRRAAIVAEARAVRPAGPAVLGDPRAETTAVAPAARAAVEASGALVTMIGEVK